MNAAGWLAHGLRAIDTLPACDAGAVARSIAYASMLTDLSSGAHRRCAVRAHPARGTGAGVRCHADATMLTRARASRSDCTAHGDIAVDAALPSRLAGALLGGRAGAVRRTAVAAHRRGTREAAPSCGAGADVGGDAHALRAELNAAIMVSIAHGCGALPARPAGIAHAGQHGIGASAVDATGRCAHGAIAACSRPSRGARAGAGVGAHAVDTAQRAKSRLASRACPSRATGAHARRGAHPMDTRWRADAKAAVRSTIPARLAGAVVGSIADAVDASEVAATDGRGAIQARPARRASANARRRAL